MDYDALIIGAGASGLAALRELHRAGLHVLCIEALDRIGGRVYTVHDPASPEAIELGAEFIHGRPPQIFDLIEEARLPVVERSHEIHPPDNAPDSSDADYGGMWQVMSAMEDAAEQEPDRSFAQFAAGAPFSDAAKRAATNYVEGFNAARADVVSIQSLAQESKAADQIEGDRSFHLRQGYDAIARTLLPSENAVRLNTVAQRVQWKRGEAIVHASTAGTAETLRARHLIITVSLGVLQAGAIHFDPEPASALDAARALAFGDAVRVTIRFDSMPGFIRPGFILSDAPVFPTWWSSLPAPAPLITGWSAGPKADALRGKPSERIVAYAIESLWRLTDAPLPPIAETYFHDWHADPFFRGAYSYVPAGKLSARAQLAQPVEDTLYFAGEAANTSGHGATVHGAIESGRAAARCVIAHCRSLGK
ncbi:MAG TPA: NAD(P)/FAD-dependent oxidoreductase [Rhizomicrobium sp.]|nr:NAD(P)/FAD-dependent oxidoreductase [Rhizomicrobium sp.]